MSAIILSVTGVLIITKFFDLISTLQRIQTAQDESNPLVQKLVIRFGIRGAIWIMFTLAIIIILLAGTMANNGGRLMKYLFIIAGVFMSVVQTSVAHANWTGRQNWITMKIRRLFRIITKILK